MSAASPRISGAADALDDVLGLMVRNVSRSVCSWNVPGVSAVGMARKFSSGETASVEADRTPYLSHPRYLLLSVHVSGRFPQLNNGAVIVVVVVVVDDDEDDDDRCGKLTFHDYL
jgi:hypothetical protein